MPCSWLATCTWAKNFNDCFALQREWDGTSPFGMQLTRTWNCKCKGGWKTVATDAALERSDKRRLSRNRPTNLLSSCKRRFWIKSALYKNCNVKTLSGLLTRSLIMTTMMMTQLLKPVECRVFFSAFGKFHVTNHANVLSIGLLCSILCTSIVRQCHYVIM